MRKVKLQMQLSLDGFVAGPEGQLDWMSTEMVAKNLEVLQELTESMDNILLGRKMTAGFTSYWENVVNSKPESPEYAYAKIFVDTPKIVFSKTAKTVSGKNVTLENGDLKDAIGKLKGLPGKDIIVYGGAGFVSSMLQARLIDELNLFINPVAIGSGLKIFDARYPLELMSSTAFDNGIIYCRYKPKAV